MSQPLKRQRLNLYTSEGDGVPKCTITTGGGETLITSNSSDLELESTLGGSVKITDNGGTVSDLRGSVASNIDKTQHITPNFFGGSNTLFSNQVQIGGTSNPQLFLEGADVAAKPTIWANDLVLEGKITMDLMAPTTNVIGVLAAPTISTTQITATNVLTGNIVGDNVDIQAELNLAVITPAIQLEGVDGADTAISIEGTVDMTGAITAETVNTTNLSVSSGSIALCDGAGGPSQGTNSVAIGFNAGIAQGSDSVAIGQGAAYNTQGTDCVAVGTWAGFQSQANNSVCVGASAGYFSTANSVYIGHGAGGPGNFTDVVVINADSTQATLDPTDNNQLTITTGTASLVNDENSLAPSSGVVTANTITSTDPIVLMSQIGGYIQFAPGYPLLPLVMGLYHRMNAVGAQNTTSVVVLLSEATSINYHGSLTIPANAMRDGTLLAMQIGGTLQAAAGSSVTIRCMYGPTTVSSIVMVFPVAITTAWDAQYTLLSPALDAVRTMGKVTYFDGTGSAMGGATIANDTVDSTIANEITVDVQWDTASVDNNIIMSIATVRVAFSPAP